MTNITINITTGDIIADGISLINHVHGGVQAGTSTTGAPQ
jgi:phage baseplate assembly protein gpV